MARQFWSEVHDLRAPVDEGPRRARSSRTRKRAVRKVSAARRAERRLA